MRVVCFMNITGIVAEYNPYHNGHEYMVQKCREEGATHIVAVQSGNFVQRGSVAIMDKRSRAAAALKNGVDLVLELPVPWAVSTAELFAQGGLSVLAGLGCVKTLAFGCETAEKEKLKAAADAVCSEEVDRLIAEELSGGITYALARENAVRRVFGDETADLLSKPNNILAVEYLKAMRLTGTPLEIMPIRRRGAEHDSLKENGEFSSASALRIMLERGDERAFEFMPESSVAAFLRLKKTGRAPVAIDDSERAILSRLRILSPEEIKKAPDVSEGLENRIYNAIQSATSLEELYEIVKTKRYTHSRIRRIVTALYLGITPEDTKCDVPYVRVLGFNERGREILKIARDTATKPVVMKSSQFSELSLEAKHIFSLECKATNLYNLATPRILPCGTELTDEVVML